MKIGFVGLGNMGAPMARNLLKAGHALSVFDVVQRNMDTLAGAGAAPAASAAKAAAEADLVITMLPSATQVKEVYLGKDGVLSGVRTQVPLIDSSTIDPECAREVAATAADAGNSMADAPVSGGAAGAAAATLTFMVGATPELFDKITPVLKCMGTNIAYCGAPGAGQVAKICNNMLLAISMIGVAESMSLGAALGIDPKVLASVINSSSGRCWSSETNNPFPGVMENVPAARGFAGGFGTDLMLQDLSVATDAAEQVGQPVLMGAMAHQLYQMFSAQGCGGLDFSAIINLVRRAR